MTACLIAICVVLAAANILTFIFMRKSLAGQKDLCAEELEREKKLNAETFKRQSDLLEEQKFKMAESNLKLLEQSEDLEEQKFRMAEANLKLLELNEAIQRERERSEALLLNILPPKVASDLKDKGRTDPESFDNVTVYFSDIVGFTEKSGKLDPKTLIDELNDIFTAFDRIIKKNGCERIKTIGDAYMCVCGMPVANEKHAFNIVASSIEIIRFVRERNLRSPIKWEIRIGIHTGKVVGGVVGIEKYIYDVFGDTINTASRMESNSEPMKINISEMTYNQVRDDFKYIERGFMEVKGKGPVKMYFVEA